MVGSKRRKNSRGGASSSTAPPAPPAPATYELPPASSPLPSPASTRPPWPRDEGIRIPSSIVWGVNLKKAVEKDECVFREISEQWDEYDTLFYNAWLGIDIRPTRFVDNIAMRIMGIQRDVLHLVQKIGLGTICLKQYDLYPDLVRQFLATARVYYANEVVKNALEGTLTFLIYRVRYRLPLRDLCGIYGFERDFIGVALPAQFPGAQIFWFHFGNKAYDSKTSTQIDVRHPVLRYVTRAIGNTFLCKMEPGKMRLAELILLSYAVGDLCGDECCLPINVNMGAVFAHHLVSLKTKPFSGTGKKTESVGSLLTPIFQHFGIRTEGCSIVTTRSLMNEEYLKHAKWIKDDWLWCFSDTTGEHMVQLPDPELTAIGEDPHQLLFEPDPRLLITPQPSRRRRIPPLPTADPGASSSSAPAQFGTSTV
ncbi:uncharacterized protein LOC111828955 [Capsella rubella]|uniref:uncharacterized protein LOC111828955 n=1 Tax=Capsella rubella TaxID=81985 RepID=UPI000CD512BF|nr:uncharacterized protein LOC111828955 [Capsella rubella]